MLLDQESIKRYQLALKIMSAEPSRMVHAVPGVPQQTGGVPLQLQALLAKYKDEFLVLSCVNAAQGSKKNIIFNEPKHQNLIQICEKATAEKLSKYNKS